MFQPTKDGATEGFSASVWHLRTFRLTKEAASDRRSAADRNIGMFQPRLAGDAAAAQPLIGTRDVPVAIDRARVGPSDGPPRRAMANPGKLGP